MPQFTLKQHNVPVTLPEGLSEDQLLSFHPFNSWVATLTKSLSQQASNSSHPFHSDPYAMRSITIQSFDIFGRGENKRLGFVKLSSDISNAAGEKLTDAVFLRGPSVGMLVMLVPDDAPDGSDERYALLTVQPRPAAGSLAFVELPAGMVDEAGNFAGTAAKEIQEELGLEIPAKELTCLSDLAGRTAKEKTEERGEEEELAEAMYPSAGGCDEYVPIYMHERRVPRAQLSEWTGKLTGLREDGEKITLKLVKMQDLWWEGRRDAKCLAAIALWENLRRAGKI